jgi:23S rRNA pseudouridine955/2504/2580 synthase
VAAGQLLRVPPAEAAPAERARPAREVRALSDDDVAFARSLVIHRSEHALVLDKPPGLAVQGGTRTDVHVDGLLPALQFDAKERPRLVHRLDKDTSGVLLLARTARAAAFFGKCFATRDTKKLYWALLMGVPEPADIRVDLPIAKQPGTGGEKMHVDRGVAHPGDGQGGRAGEFLRDAAAYRADAPVAGACGGDRASDRGGREIWGEGGVPDRGHLAQAPPPRAAAGD